MKYFISLFFALLSFSLLSQIDVINHKVGIGTLTPQHDIHMKGTDLLFTDSHLRIKMYIDSTGKIGIGTMAPQALFHIDANGPVHGLIESNDDDAALRLKNGSGEYGLLIPSTNDELTFWNFGTNKNLMSILPDGKIRFSTYVGTNHNTPLSSILGVDENGFIVKTDAAALDHDLWNESGSDVYRNSNVGIGTMNPSEKFQVWGGSNGEVFTAAKLSHADPSWGSGEEIALDFAQHNATVGRISGAYNQTLGVFQMRHYGYNDLSTPIMTLGGGKVGIGTITPSSKLDVAGKTTTTQLQVTTGAATGKVLQSDATGNATWVDPTTLAVTNDNMGNHSASQNVKLNGKWLSGDGGNEGIAISNDGKVGIGTSTPNRTLQAAGIISSKVGSIEGLININANSVYMGSQSINQLELITGAIPRLSITTAGNVGIGTTTPSSKLDVAGKTKTTQLQVTTGAATGKVLQSDTAGNATWVDPTTLAVPNDNMGNHTATQNVKLNGKWLSGDGGNEGITVSNDGKVGIGTSTPSEKFTIKSNIYSKVGSTMEFPLAVNRINSETPSIMFGTDNQLNGVVAGSNIGIRFGRYYGNDDTFHEHFRTTQSGNVGIGTTSPSSKLDIAGKTKTTQLQVTTGAASGKVLQSDATGNATWVNPTTLAVTNDNMGNHSATQNLKLNGKWISGDGGNEGITVSNDGKVGIGTAVPTANFEVKSNTNHFRFHDGASNRTPFVSIHSETGKATGIATGTQGSAIMFDNTGFFGITKESKENITNGSSSGGALLVKVENNGNVGIGTNTIHGKLHLRNALDGADQYSGLRFYPANSATSGSNSYHRIAGFRKNGLMLSGSANGSSHAKTNLFLTDSGFSVGMSNGYSNPEQNKIMTLLNNGNVGIGTNTIHGKLHLRNALDGADQYSGLRFYPATSTTSGSNSYHRIVGFRKNGLMLSGSANGSSHSKTNLFLTDSGFSIGMSDGYSNPEQNKIMTLLNNGKVGIGKTNPSNKLNIQNNTTFHPHNASSAILTEGHYGGGILMKDGSKYGGMYMIDHGTKMKITMKSNASTNKDIITLKDNGYVGLGVHNPYHLLDLGNSLGKKLAMYQNTQGGDFYGFGISPSTLEFHAGSALSASADMVLKSGSGNVGIGTTNPIYRMHTKGDIYADGGWFRVSGSAGLYFQSYGGGFYMSDHSWIRTYGNKNFYHNTGIMRTDGILQVGPNGNRLIANSNGRVGINTTNPGATLHVNGSLAYAGRTYLYSDKKLKKNISNFDYGLKEVLKLNPIKFTYKKSIVGDDDKQTVGLIAQELQKAAPNLVSTFEHPQIDTSLKSASPEEYLAIEESAIKYMLINAIKEQQKQIDALKNNNSKDLNHEITPTPSSDEVNEFRKEINQQAQEIETLKILVEALLEEKVSGLDRIEVALENSIELESPYISQNIPNPTSNDAIIKYYVPENAISAKINFFSLSGQPLKSVDIDQMGQGELKVDLDRMMSGSYLYNLTVDGQLIDTKTMVIIK